MRALATRLRLRPGLAWALGSTVLASAGVLVFPQGQGSEKALPPAPAERQFIKAGSAPASRPALPSDLPALTLEPAESDPFSGTPMAPAAPAVVAVAPAPVPAPPPPPAPVPGYRFAGRMTLPSGEVVTLLGRGAQLLAAKAGLRLDDGFVVESVGEQSIRLHYPSLDVRAEIPVPPATDTRATLVGLR